MYNNFYAKFTLMTQGERCKIIVPLSDIHYLWKQQYLAMGDMYCDLFMHKEELLVTTNASNFTVLHVFQLFTLHYTSPFISLFILTSSYVVFCCVSFLRFSILSTYYSLPIMYPSLYSFSSLLFLLILPPSPFFSWYVLLYNFLGSLWLSLHSFTPGFLTWMTFPCELRWSKPSGKELYACTNQCAGLSLLIKQQNVTNKTWAGKCTIHVCSLEGLGDGDVARLHHQESYGKKDLHNEWNAFFCVFCQCFFEMMFVCGLKIGASVYEVTRCVAAYLGSIVKESCHVSRVLRCVCVCGRQAWCGAGVSLNEDITLKVCMLLIGMCECVCMCVCADVPDVFFFFMSAAHQVFSIVYKKRVSLYSL